MADKTEKSTVQLIIDGERSKVSLKELGAALKVTRNEFRLLREADDPKAYAEKEAALKKLNQEYKESKAKINEITKASFELKDVWKEVFKGNLGANAVSVGLEMLKQGVTAVKDKIYDLSDSLADVQKASGLTNSEIRKLNGELSSIDTRTLNKDLRDIAQIGGKNGIMDVASLAGFTKSTDMINVSLGDQFDNVTELSESLINMRTIFSDIKSDNIGDDVLHIGNALNYLDAQGTASGKGMVDFASRMGGTLIPLGLTSGQILGLSATMEELSITAERGSTAVNTIFQKMLTNVDGFARVAGMKSKDFANLLNTDIYAAFNKFVAGAKNGGAQATEFAKILEDTELSGSGASEVVLKLASNQKKLSDHVTEATQSLKESNTITDEFNKKNNNAAAVMDKFSKIADNALEKVALLGINAVEGFGRLFGMINKTTEQFAKLNEQQSKVTKITNDLLPLVARYEVLKDNVHKTTQEQAELKKITQEIGQIVPGAVTKWDAYGRAMDVNTTKTKEFTKQQMILMEVMRQDRRDLLKEDLQKYESQILGERNKLKIGKTFTPTIGSGGLFGSTGTGSVGEKFTDSQYQTQLQKVNELQLKIDATKKDLKALNGDFIVPKAAVKVLETNTGNVTGGKTLTKEEQKAADKKKREEEAAKRKLDKENRDHGSEQTKLINFRAAQGEYEKKVKEEADKKADKELKEQREYEAAENKYDLEQAEKEAKANFDITNNTLDMAAAKTTNDPTKIQDINQAKLDAEEAYLSQLFLLRKTYGQDTSDLEQQLAELSIDRAAQTTSAEKRSADLQKEAAFGLQMAKAQALEEGAAALKSFFKEHTVIYKALFAVEKAGAVAQIIVGAQKEIAGYWASSAELGPVAGPIVAAGLTAVTVARSAASIATIGKQVIDVAVPGREVGGYTDLSSLRTSTSPAGYVSQPTFFQQGARSFIAGEKYKQEYVVPFDMLQDPTIRAVTENLESMRISGKRPGNSTGGSGSGDFSGNVEALLISNINATKDLQKSLEEGRIGVNFNYKEFSKFKDYIDHIYKETSL